MKVALACWNQRIAPVFDVAGEIRVIEVETGRIVGDIRQVLPQETAWQKAKRLKALKVDTLICGAISRPMQEYIAREGIKVCSFVAGNLDRVVESWLQGGLDDNPFVMPGCGGNCRRRRRGQGQFDQK